MTERSTPPKTLRHRVANALGASLGSRVDAFFVRKAFQTPAHELSADAQRQVQQELAEATTGYPDILDTPMSQVRAFDLDDGRRVRRIRNGEVLDLVLPSHFKPHHPKFESLLASMPRVAHAHIRWFRHHEPRPALVMLHGWGMGHAEVDARLLQARYLFGRGLDVAFVAAPFHGKRVPQARRKPAFPSSRPIRAIEGFAMWIADVASLVSALRDRGAATVGLCGISMGGFASALAATTEHAIDFIAPVIPFADLPGLLWEQAERGGIDPAAAANVTREQFVGAFDAIAPLERRPRPTHMHVFGGRYDRVTPVKHARDLAAHFECAYTELSSSHLLQLDPVGWVRPVADALLGIATR